jgi:acyl-CoA synthetase (NDP forming)
MFVIWGAPPGTDDTFYFRLLDGGLPVFRTFSNCVRAVRAHVDYWQFVDRYQSPFADAPVEPLPGADRAREVLATVGAEGTLSEHSSKKVLAAYGIRSNREELCTTAPAAARAAKSLGEPVVMKVSSPALSHKSDLGLVRLGISGATAVRRTFDELMNVASRETGREAVEGVLVCEQHRGGVEMVVGISRDPLFGPVVMVGVGGVFVEILRDVSFRVPPFGSDEAERMVRELQAFPLLDGARGTKPADLDALVDVIMKVQRLALDLADDVVELDINPLLVTPRGAVALDALVVTN